MKILRFAVLADAHIGRSIPLAIAEHRRQAFCRAFKKAVDAIIEAGVDYVFFCGDLFERRTLRPHLVQFAHDELYRLVRGTEERHKKGPKILVIRGNHDGRPQSDTLDYIKHPLAGYLHVFEEECAAYTDERLHVVGLNYYDRVSLAFDRLAKPAFEDAKGMRILMLHAFVQGYNKVPPYESYLTLDQLASVDPAFVFAGHYHKRCPQRRLPNGGWVLTPGSLEMYDFAEDPEKGFYIVDADEGKPQFKWVPIEPMHVMRQATVETEERKKPAWYRERILKSIDSFRFELEKQGKPGYLRVRVRGRLKEGFPGDIDLTAVGDLVESDPLLLWVDVDILGLEPPLITGPPERERIDIAEFFSDFGDFAEEIRDMHTRVREVLEEEASLQTGLLIPSKRAPLAEEWAQRFEEHDFKREAV
jgi:DNA repair exonuclease SbcCD nuclease subunit